MPVINLPQDTRFGDLGAGLGKLVGGLLSAYGEQQTQKGVAEILSDSSIAPDKLPSEVFKKFGNNGIAALAKLNALQEQQDAHTKSLAQVGLISVQQKLDEAKLPTAPAAAQAGLEHLQAQTTTEKARPALLGAEASQATAQAANIRALTEPTAALREQEASEARQRAQQLYLQNQQATSGVTPNFDITLAPFNLPPADAAKWKASLEEAYKSAKPGAGMAAVQERLRSLSTAEKAQAELPTPTAIENRAQNSSQAAAATKDYIKAFREDPSASGLMSGASITAYLEHRGIPTGEANQVQMRIAQLNIAAQKATQGGGFYSAGRFAVAKDVTAGTNETPLYAIEALRQSADQALAAAETDKSALTGRQRSQPVDKAISEWKEIKAITDSFQSSVYTDARGNKRTVVYFDGKQVDPKSFKPLIENNTSATYQVGDKKVTGSQVFQASAAPGVSMPPDEVLQYWQAQARQAQ